MNDKDAIEVVNKIFINIFGKKCPYNLDELLEEIAFDIKLPQQVQDNWKGETTWASSTNPSKFMTQKNTEIFNNGNWMIKKRDISSFEDIIKIWKKINYTTTERIYDSSNISKSDTIYNCENLYRCNDCRKCKNSLYLDGCATSEFVIACQRTGNSSFCIRVDDSGDCTNSYNVICSAKISNSFFIQDCNSLHECMFCSHISNKKYCISNMQFEKEEYFEIKREIVKWILKKENKGFIRNEVDILCKMC